MNNRLSYALVFAVVGSLTIAACSDDDSTGTGGDGGGAGEPTSSAGTKTGGSSSGGSSIKAGTDAGGNAGNGTAGSGTAGAADGGMGGVSEGGANSAGASSAGAGGEGGAGELVYTCGSDTQYKKVCSAKVAANCTEPTDCSDCLTQVSDDYEGAKTDCAACDALVLDYYQCGVDAFETGDTAAGMQCIDGVGADFSDSCFEGVFMNQYLACSTYLEDHACPATWPPQ